METLAFKLPTMYGDHHVVEVRRILQEMPGVEDIYASSSFHIVEVTCDPAQVSKEQIEERLSQAGYFDELPVPTETGLPATDQNGGPKYFRHSAAFENTKSVISFTQSVNYAGRPLWPCPGIGPVNIMDEGE